MPAAPPDSLIVQYRAGADLAARRTIRETERLLTRASKRDAGIEIVRPRDRSLQAAMKALQQQPDVELVSINHRRELFNDPSGEELWRHQWGNHNDGQPVNGYLGVADVDIDGLEAAATGPDASSVVVAVTDDGVDFSHPDLAGRAWVNPGESGAANGVPKESNGVDDDHNGFVDDVNGWDFCNNDNTVHDPDEDFHGTAVAGTIAASLNGVGTVGVAPNVRIMAVKWLVEGRCDTDDLAIAAINYAASFGVRIINASWGGDGSNPLMEAAVANSGALFVAAAGNDGRNTDSAPQYPAAFTAPNVLSVAAIHNQGRLSNFSNYGPVSVDIAAPGEDVALTFPQGEWYCPSGWCLDSGTSFAAPYVAGVAALVGAVHPSLLASPAALRDRILATGAPLSSTTRLTASGRLVNAHRAIDVTGPVLSSAPTAVPLASSTLGGSTVRMRLGWAPATDLLGVAGYRVEQRRNGGGWALATAITASRHVDLTIALGSAYEFRVQPFDPVGNGGAWSPSVVFTAARHQENSGLARTSGPWRTAATSSASGGRTRYTTRSGASLTFAFTGQAVAVIAPRSRTRSSFRVYLDGALVRSVSLHSRVGQNRQVVFASGSLTPGAHTLRLVNARTGGRTRADVDAFVVFR